MTLHEKSLNCRLVGWFDFFSATDSFCTKVFSLKVPYSQKVYWLCTSVQPKPGFGISNRNQDQVSVSVSGPELFLPKPKLSPILKIYQKAVSFVWRFQKGRQEKKIKNAPSQSISPHYASSHIIDDILLCLCTASYLYPIPQDQTYNLRVMR